MILTYWVATRTDDNPCYSIRKKTKKAVEALLEENTAEWGTPWTRRFGAPRKITVEYKDAFDLMSACLDGEDAGGFEADYGQFS